MTSISERIRRANGVNAKLQLRVGRLRLGLLWLIALPAAAIGTAVFVLPIADPSLTSTERWSVATVTALLLAASVAVHGWAHLLAARVTGSHAPPEVPLTPFGDPAQVWSDAPDPWHDAVTAAAGIAASAAVAWVSWMLWNAQINPYANGVAMVLGIFNLVVAAVNVTPAYPFDGARLAGAVLRGIGGLEFRTSRTATIAGFAVVAAIAGWGVYLFLERDRFSTATGSIAFTLAALVLVPLVAYRPSRRLQHVPARGKRSAATYLRLALTVPLIAVMFAPIAGLMPVNEGIQAPGSAVSTEEMVSVPDDVRNGLSGSFLLTTIILQTPIIAVEWLAAKTSPVIALVPPERVVPPGTTPQSVAQQAYNALVTSEQTAVVVGMRLAGYEVVETGEGAFVNSVVEDSPARDLVRAGDVITAVNGEPVTSTNDLIALVRATDPSQQVTLTIRRGGEEQEVTTGLIPPATPDGAPRIGIVIETANLSYELPFPVEITPKRIAGGPSAGLMFTLTVYDMVTEDDLTRGRKIAGTGTIDINGNVGPIGGVEQKVAAAERAGAEYFLVPAQNYAAAAAVAGKIEVVQVTTAQEAIDFLKGLPPR